MSIPQLKMTIEADSTQIVVQVTSIDTHGVSLRARATDSESGTEMSESFSATRGPTSAC
jgi:hypothetical protein